MTTGVCPDCGKGVLVQGLLNGGGLRFTKGTSPRLFRFGQETVAWACESCGFLSLRLKGTT